MNEVKRQAMSELQKAVSEAERKAHEMISSERAKMERTVAEAKRQAAEDALIIINQQEDSSEVGRQTVLEPLKLHLALRLLVAFLVFHQCGSHLLVKLCEKKINICKLCSRFLFLVLKNFFFPH